MGIGVTEAEGVISAVKAQFAGSNNRQAKMRKQVGAAIDRLTEFAAKLDAQLADAPQAFAVDKQSQFNTFVEGLPDPDLDPNPRDPPNSEV